ncbi:lysophosphatidic acid receptor 4-like isoform X2 [Dendronephthya gigantea]|nr:lysophosphatidic acid receptor 4-like isoform X2 [Dendronephthya gigantea]
MSVSSIGMLCNLLLILVMLINPLKVLHRGAWVTILNLSIADCLASGSLFSKLCFHQIEGETPPKWLEITLNFLWMFSVSASFMLLALLTVQVYMIIKYPVKSRLMITKCKIAVTGTIIWILAICMGLSQISYIWMINDDLSMRVFCLYIVAIAILEIATAFQVVLKILIAIEILKSRRQLKNAKIPNKKEKDVAKTVIILNLILIVTAFPYFVAKQIAYVTRLRLGTDPMFINFSYYYEPIALLNFVTNPLLYSLRLQDYRRSLLALFNFNCKKRPPSQPLRVAISSIRGSIKTTETTKL